MANGYCPYLLTHAETMMRSNYAGHKVTPPGFLSYLLAQKGSVANYNEVISGDDGSGHIREVRYKYRPRMIPEQAATTDTCELDVQPSWSEATISRTLFRKIAFHISDEEIAQYCRDASQTVMVGKPATKMMNEHYDFLLSAINGLVGAMNKDLLAEMATSFGVNAVTGNNTAVTVNIAQDTTVNDLSAGIVRILADASFNELCGRVSIVGSGLMNNYELQRQFLQCCDEKGFNGNAFLSRNPFYNDNYADVAWGDNQIGVFADNTAFLVDIDRFTGFRAGQRPNSFFTNMAVPVAHPCNPDLSALGIDIQLKYYDCPVEGGGYDGEDLDRGWAVILSKSFDLLVPPSNYRAGDRLSGVNGALRYTITNS
jgi:hypothetical protein